MSRVLGVVAAVGGLATLILHVISLATAVWVVTAIDSRVIASQGLWQTCASEICFNLPQGILLDYYKAVQAFMIIACITLALAFGVSGVMAMGKGERKIPRIAVGLFSFSTICIIIAMAVFTGETFNEVNLNPNLSYGYSFILGWIACVFSFILTIVAGIATKSQ